MYEVTMTALLNPASHGPHPGDPRWSKGEKVTVIAANMSHAREIARKRLETPPGDWLWYFRTKEVKISESA